MNSPTALRCRVGLGALATAAAITFGSFVSGGSAAAFEAQPLPRNELAEETSAAAKMALAALDRYEATDAYADLVDYLSWRSATAIYAADQLGYDSDEMRRAWAVTPMSHQRAVIAAMTQVGVPYRTHSSIEEVGFDCSGLTSFAWGRAGHDLFRQSGTQIREAAPLDRETARAGDLVHYPGHVMIYLGIGDAIIHSVHSGRTVEVDTISERRRNTVSFGDPTS
ncbi:MAG: NlpC/P60 family protein [Actinomycetota bacterium]